jgi:uncharacterized protein YjbJ (UPF0337 family)
MNIDLLIGVNIYLFGILQERGGRLLGNTKLQATGAQTQARGRCRLVMGDARRIIERCKKKQKKSTSVSHARPTAT